MRDDDFNAEDFQPAPAPESVLTASARSRRRRPRKQFVMVPMSWVDRLATARCIATLKVAHHLLYRSFKEDRQMVRLANGALASNGVSPKQKERALAELEAIGLVKVDRRTRKSPDVTLLYPEEGG